MCGHKVRKLPRDGQVDHRFLPLSFFLDISMRILASMAMAWPFFQSPSMDSLVKAIYFAFLCSEQGLPRMLNRIKVCRPYAWWIVM